MEERDLSEVRALSLPPSTAGTHSGSAPSTRAAAGGAQAHNDAARRLLPPRDTRLHEDVLAVILTCGDGAPLEALTRWRSRAALPFAGQYRGMDFTLSN